MGPELRLQGVDVRVMCWFVLFRLRKKCVEMLTGSKGESGPCAGVAEEELNGSAELARVGEGREGLYW